MNAFSGTLMLMLGVAIPVIGAYMSSRAQRELSWVKLRARIVSSDVIFDGELYEPAIRFEYRVGASAYTGSKVRTGLIKFNWKGPARRMCERFPVGTEVPVFVDPVNPLSAVLEPGSDPRLVPTTVGIGLVFALIGLALLGAR
jgi:hypothetical protein